MKRNRRYRVFVRDWWKETTEPDFPNGYRDGLEPYPDAPKTTLGFFDTESEARARCQWYRESHEPGRYSRKAEYEDTGN